MIRPPTTIRKRRRPSRMWIERLGRWWVVLILLAGVLGFVAAFRSAAADVHPTGDLVAGMPDVRDLQLSFTEDRFSAVLAEWSGESCVEVANAAAMDRARAAGAPCTFGGEVFPDGVEAFKRSVIVLDFAFPVVYSLFAVAAILWVWRIGRTGYAAAARTVTAAVVMGGSDWMENVFHLVALRDIDTYAEAAAANLPGQVIAAASVFATVKIGLIVCLLGAFALGVLARVWRFVRRIGPRLSQ